MIFRIINAVMREVGFAYRKATFLDLIHSKEKSVILRGKLYLNATDVSIGKNVVFFEGVSIYGEGKIIIGDNCNIGKDTCIYASNGGGITIGNNTNIAAQCYIIDCDHGIKKDVLIGDQPLISKKITIGEDVWLGVGVKVLKGVNIANGAVIGAAGVVNKDVEDNMICVGVPAKAIGRRC